MEAKIRSRNREFDKLVVELQCSPELSKTKGHPWQVLILRLYYGVPGHLPSKTHFKTAICQIQMIKTQGRQLRWLFLLGLPAGITHYSKTRLSDVKLLQSRPCN